MKAFIILISVLFVSTLYAQVKSTKEMTYDPENQLFWKVSNDEQNLYLEIYKDEYASKVDMQGGMKLFFNLDGKKDTLQTPSVQFPVYQRPKNWEIIKVTGFNDIPDGEISIYNEHGILAEAKLKEIDSKKHIKKEQYIFEGKLSIPLTHLTTNKNNQIAIQILLKGMRSMPLPAGRVSPVLASSSTGSQETTDFFANVDTWTHCWIIYNIK